MLLLAESVRLINTHSLLMSRSDVAIGSLCKYLWKADTMSQWEGRGTTGWRVRGEGVRGKGGGGHSGTRCIPTATRGRSSECQNHLVSKKKRGDTPTRGFSV